MCFVFVFFFKLGTCHILPLSAETIKQGATWLHNVTILVKHRAKSQEFSVTGLGKMDFLLSSFSCSLVANTRWRSSSLSPCYYWPFPRSASNVTTCCSFNFVAKSGQSSGHLPSGVFWQSVTLSRCCLIVPLWEIPASSILCLKCVTWITLLRHKHKIAGLPLTAVAPSKPNILERFNDVM